MIAYLLRGTNLYSSFSWVPIFRNDRDTRENEFFPQVDRSSKKLRPLATAVYERPLALIHSNHRIINPEFQSLKITWKRLHLWSQFFQNTADQGLNIDYIFNNSNKGKKIISNLEKLNKDTKAKFDRREKIIIDLDNEINQKKNILDKKELSSKIENLKKMAEDLRSFKNNQSNIYNQKRSSELKIFFLLSSRAKDLPQIMRSLKASFHFFPYSWE